MEEILNDQAEVSNEQEEVVLETTDDTNDNEDDSFDWKAEALKQKEIAQNQKARAEKAESKVKTVKSEPAPKSSPKAGELGSKDLIALMEAKVSADDIDEVTDFAKFKGISVAEALKTSYIKSTLAEKAEKRNIAAATNVGGTKRSSGKTPDDVLLTNARNGIMPENDADLDRLLRLRKGL